MSNTVNNIICDKCGVLNEADSKFCYQCGHQFIKGSIPFECINCRTVNVGHAKFCKVCGNLLIKIVDSSAAHSIIDVEEPVVNIEKPVVNIEEPVVNIIEIADTNIDKDVEKIEIPVSNDTSEIGKIEIIDEPIQKDEIEPVVKASAKKTVIKRQKVEKEISNKMFRIISICITLVSLIGLYLIIMPPFMAIKFLNVGVLLDKSNIPLTGYRSFSYIIDEIIKSSMLSITIVDWTIAICVLIVCLALLTIAIEYIVRAITARRSKKISIYLLISFTVSAAFACVVLLMQYEILSFLDDTLTSAPIKATYVTFFMPVISLLLLIATYMSGHMKTTIKIIPEEKK